LIWLALEFKYHSLEDVDSIVSVKISNKNQDPICYRIVSRFMLHGPRGVVNPKAKYMKKNKCSKYFPKTFKK
jgi:hypothetical protein